MNKFTKILCHFFLISGFSFVFAQEKIDHVVLISIDGLRPDFYLNNKWPAPSIQELANSGIAVEKVKPVFPSVTYPSHTTIITGKKPNEHGVLYNTSIIENGKPGNWITDFDSIKSVSLWEVLKKNNLTTASFSWPVSTKSPFIDYNIPEIWNPNNPIDRISAMDSLGTPVGFLKELQRHATGKLQTSFFNVYSNAYDENISRMAAYTIEKYKPNFISIHLPCTDIAQHIEGMSIDSNLVRKAVANADHGVAIIMDALKRADLLKNTAVFITGDHGFANSTITISPNYWLKKHKIGNGKDVFFFSTGGSSFLHLKKTNQKKAIEKVKKMLNSLSESIKSKFTILNAKEIQLSGGDDTAILALTANEGVSFDNDFDREITKTQVKGKHGHYPNFESIYTGLIVYNPEFTHKKIEKVSITEIFDLIKELLINQRIPFEEVK